MSKIIHFVERFSTVSETFIYESICEMQRQRVNEVVLTHAHVNSSTRLFNPVVVVQQGYSCRMHPLRITVKILDLLHCLRAEDYYFRLRQARIATFIKKSKPSFIFAHFGPSGYLIASIAQRYKIPFAVSFHGYDVFILSNLQMWRKRYTELFKSAKFIQGVSQFVCAKLINLGASEDKVRLVHNGIDLNKFHYSDPSKRFDGTSVKCIFVGRFTEKKDPLCLLRAFKIAIDKCPTKKITLKLCGDGDLMPQVQLLITELKLSNYVEIMGALPHDQVLKHMHQAHLYIQHSRIASNGDCEGLPVSITEAMAIGLPVISTEHSGIPEVVEHGVTGLLSQENDVESMARNIVELCENSSIWSSMSQNARKKIEVDFDIKKQTRMLIDLIVGDR